MNKEKNNPSVVKAEDVELFDNAKVKEEWIYNDEVLVKSKEKDKDKGRITKGKHHRNIRV